MYKRYELIQVHVKINQVALLTLRFIKIDFTQNDYFHSDSKFQLLKSPDSFKIDEYRSKMSKPKFAVRHTSLNLQDATNRTIRSVGCAGAAQTHPASFQAQYRVSNRGVQTSRLPKTVSNFTAVRSETVYPFVPDDFGVS